MPFWFLDKRDFARDQARQSKQERDNASRPHCPSPKAREQGYVDPSPYMDDAHKKSIDLGPLFFEQENEVKVVKPDGSSQKCSLNSGCGSHWYVVVQNDDLVISYNSRDTDQAPIIRSVPINGSTSGQRKAMEGWSLDLTVAYPFRRWHGDTQGK